MLQRFISATAWQQNWQHGCLVAYSGDQEKENWATVSELTGSCGLHQVLNIEHVSHHLNQIINMHGSVPLGDDQHRIVRTDEF